MLLEVNSFDRKSKSGIERVETHLELWLEALKRERDARVNEIRRKDDAFPVMRSRG